MDPCLFDNICAPTAICTTANHVSACTCPPGYVGNPLVSCSPKGPPLPVEAEDECQIDSDCPSGRACLEHKCRNPCYELNPCAASAICSVVDTTPFRTMICSCREGWIPDTDRSCVPIETTNSPGCVRDDECEKDSACLNRICMNPCDCGKGADCFLSNHRPVCQCPEGTVGNPQVECKPVGCQSDSECQDREACSNGKCINPCLLDDPCGVNAECFPQRHIANCRCLSGYEGDPVQGCIPIGCRSDSECPVTQACQNRDCVNPCETGNPCAQNADCLVHQHLAQCRCQIGFTGDPYRSCLPFPSPECVEDKDCPSSQVCFEEKCLNPCNKFSPCNAPATCRVVDSLPIRFGSHHRLTESG